MKFSLRSKLQAATLLPLLGGALAVHAQFDILPTEDGPRIRFTRQLHNFGKVISGQVIRTDFTFTNTGNATLEITSVVPACGCTTAGEWDRTIAPGNVGRIPIQLDTARFNGPMRKSVGITSNAQDHPETTLTLIGEPWKAIDSTPPYAAFGRIAAPGETNSRTIRITSQLGPPFDLGQPVSTNEFFHASLKTINPGALYELTVTTVPPLPLGFHRSEINVPTTLAELPPLSFITSALVSKPVIITPPQLALPSGALTAATERAVQIKTHPGQSIHLSKPAITLPTVKLELNELKPRTEFILKATFPKGFLLPPNTKATVIIPTNLPDFPTLEIPVSQIN